MDKSFTWQNFDRVARMVESLGYFVLLIGPLVGLGIFIFSSGVVRFIGIAVLFGSVVIALYHISISYIMFGMRKMFESRDEPIVQESKG